MLPKFSQSNLAHTCSLQEWPYCTSQTLPWSYFLPNGACLKWFEKASCFSPRHPGRDLVPAAEAWNEDALSKVVCAQSAEQQTLKATVEFLQDARDSFSKEIPFFRAMLACKGVFAEISDQERRYTVQTLHKAVEDTWSSGMWVCHMRNVHIPYLNL